MNVIFEIGVVCFVVVYYSILFLISLLKFLKKHIIRYIFKRMDASIFKEWLLLFNKMVIDQNFKLLSGYRIDEKFKESNILIDDSNFIPTRNASNIKLSRLFLYEYYRECLYSEIEDLAKNGALSKKDIKNVTLKYEKTIKILKSINDNQYLNKQSTACSQNDIDELKIKMYRKVGIRI